MKIQHLDLATNEKAWKDEVHRLKTIIHRMEFHGRTCNVPVKNKGNTIRFGIISDIHFGQQAARPDLFRQAIKTFAQEGFKDVICAGDIIDGHGMYKGQEFEQIACGFDKQCLEMYKALDGLPKLNYSFITGSHDLSYQKKNGVSVGKELENKFGWRFIGDESGTIQYHTSNGPYSVKIVHPGGGTAYSLSYKLQRMIDSMAGGKKPQMIICGHYHKAEHLPGYRNVDAIQAGCIESQSAFMNRMGIAAMMGFWMVEIVVGKPMDLANKVKTEFVSFYEG